MVNLASIHTTSMAITHAIRDLCEHEEYVQVLREEIEEVLEQDGGWQRDTHGKLRKVNSFLKESQRFAPPTLCSSTPSHSPSIRVGSRFFKTTRLTIRVSFNRVALTSLNLSSSVEIPAGTHLSVASRNILFDPEGTPDPELLTA